MQSRPWKLAEWPSWNTSTAVCYPWPSSANVHLLFRAFFGTFGAYLSTRCTKKLESTRCTKAPGAYKSTVVLFWGTKAPMVWQLFWKHWCFFYFIYLFYIITAGFWGCKNKIILKKYQKVIPAPLLQYWIISTALSVRCPRITRPDAISPVFSYGGLVNGGWRRRRRVSGGSGCQAVEGGAVIDGWHLGGLAFGAVLDKIYSTRQPIS